MYSRTRIRKMISNIQNLDLKTGLTDEQIDFAKDKLQQLENWKAIAITKFTELSTDINTLQNQAVLIAQKLNSIETKLTNIKNQLNP